MLPSEHTHWLVDLLLLPQQLFLHQVYHMLEGFLHGQQYQECRIYLDKAFNHMCLLFCLLHKVLYLCRAGTTTWLVKGVQGPAYLYISVCPGLCFSLLLWGYPVIEFDLSGIISLHEWLQGLYRFANFLGKKKIEFDMVFRSSAVLQKCYSIHNSFGSLREALGNSSLLGGIVNFVVWLICLDK